MPVPREQVGDLELVLLRGGLHALLLGAALAHMELRHLIVVDLREVHRRRVLAADLAEHPGPLPLCRPQPAILEAKYAIGLRREPIIMRHDHERLSALAHQ